MMDVNGPNDEAAIPSNLFDDIEVDDLNVEDDVEEDHMEEGSEQCPVAAAVVELECHHHHHDSSSNNEKNNPLISGAPGGGGESDDDDDAIKALAAAVQIVQAQQQQTSDHVVQQQETVDGEVERATGQQQQLREAEEELERQEITLSARLSSSPIIAPLSEQQELLLAIDQCQMNNVPVATYVTRSPCSPNGRNNDVEQKESSNNVNDPLPVRSASPNPNAATGERFNRFPYQLTSSSSYNSSHLRQGHLELPRITNTIATASLATTGNVDSFFHGTRSAFRPFSQNRIATTSSIFNDPFGVFAHSHYHQHQNQLRQQSEQQSMAHAIYEYQQMLSWGINGTVPPQYPLTPYMPSPPPTTPVGGTYSNQIQMPHHSWPVFQQQPQHQLQQHDNQLTVLQSHQPPHPSTSYLSSRQYQQYHDRGQQAFNLRAPSSTVVSDQQRQPEPGPSTSFSSISTPATCSDWRPTIPPEPLCLIRPPSRQQHGTYKSMSGSKGKPPECTSVNASGQVKSGQQQPPQQQQLQHHKKSNDPKKYLKPKYIPLKESMFTGTATTTNSTSSSSSITTDGKPSRGKCQQHRKRSTSTCQSTAGSTNESASSALINPPIAPLSIPFTSTTLSTMSTRQQQQQNQQSSSQRHQDGGYNRSSNSGNSSSSSYSGYHPACKNSNEDKGSKSCSDDNSSRNFKK